MQNNHIEIERLVRARIKKGALWVKFTGDSMEPVLRVRDVEYVEVEMSDCYYVGDIIAFFHPTNNSLVIHRIIHSYEEYYWVKGDNNSWHDGYLTRTQIVGKVTRVKKRDHCIYEVKRNTIVAILSNAERIAIVKTRLPGAFIHSLFSPVRFFIHFITGQGRDKK